MTYIEPIAAVTPGVAGGGSTVGIVGLAVPGAVNVAEAGQAGQVLISVKDSGPGMTADNLLHLFGEGVQFNANSLQV